MINKYQNVIINSFCFFKSFLLGILICVLCKSSFANYGASCSLVPVGNTTFLNNTAYGYIKSFIEMQECSDTSSQLVLCIAPTTVIPTSYPPPPPPPCVKYTYQEGASINVSTAWGGTNDAFNSSTVSTVMQNITLNVQTINQNKLCLTMNTSNGNNTPILCKDIPPTGPAPTPPPPTPQCTLVDGSCNSGSSLHSKSLFNFSGAAYECLGKTLNKLFYGDHLCMNGENSITFLNPFSSFQKALRKSISAALVMYVIFYGIRLVLGQEDGSKNSVAGFILKILFVVYFTVGFKVGDGSSESDRQNGISTYLLPILLQVTQGFSNIILSAGGGNGTLCTFDSTKYDEGYQYYALWDAIDCRIAYYLGMNAQANLTGALSSDSTITITPNPQNNVLPNNAVASTLTPQTGSNVPPVLSSNNTLFSFFTMLLGLLLSLNLTVLVFNLAFLILFIGLMMQFISSYLVCLLTLYVMMYVAPIFVPMILFKRTKGYFDSWLKISVSVALQPAILISFIAFMLTMFDTAIYDNCVFARYDYTIQSTTNPELIRDINTFQLMVPNDDASSPTPCTKSPGYKMLSIFNGYGWTDIAFLLIEVYFLVNTYLPNVEMLRVLIFWVIFYFFSQQMSAFASNITSGPNLSNITGHLAKLVGMVSEKIEERKDKAEEKKRKGNNAKRSK